MNVKLDVRRMALWCLLALSVLPLLAAGNENTLDPGLAKAVSTSDCAAVEARLVAGASATETFEDYLRLQNFPVLFMAISGGDVCIINTLINHGADVNSELPSDAVPVLPLISPLAAAIRLGNTEVVEALLAAGARPQLFDEQGNDLIPFYINEKVLWYNKQATDTEARMGQLVEAARLNSGAR